MKKLGYIKSHAATSDEVVDDLVINFNLQKADRVSMQFKDMQIILTINEQYTSEYFGVLVFEYDDGINEEKPQFIGMSAGVDPRKPETWQGIQDIVKTKKVWDKDRFKNDL